MSPDRTLTDADIQALADALSRMQCACPFDSSEVSAIRDLVYLMRETRSNIVKGVVGVLLAAITVVLALGIKVWTKQ